MGAARQPRLRPHALTATSGSDVFAAVDGAILASLDGGRSFDARYRE